MHNRMTIKIDKRNIGIFVLAVFINTILLTALLPSYGIIILSSIISNMLLLLLEVYALTSMLLTNRRFTFEFVLSAYFLLITLLNVQHQQLHTVYYISTVLMIFGVASSVDSVVRSKRDFQTLAKYMSFFSIFFVSVFLLNNYSLEKILTASTASAIYYILTLLPFVLCLKNTFWRRLLTIVISVCCILSLKRTALIGLAMGLLFYIYAQSAQKVSSSFLRKLRIVVIAAVLFCAFLLVQDVLGVEMLDRFTTIFDDGGSNRSYIYETVWERFKELDLFEQLFGKGFNGVRYTLGIKSGYEETIVSAHNDVLEVLVDYGLIGLCLYVGFVTKHIKHCIRMVKLKSRYAGAAVANIALFIVISMFSHLVIYPTYFINIVMMMALVQKNSTLERREE